jgi:iron complex outermembrane receptor protein
MKQPRLRLLPALLASLFALPAVADDTARVPAAKPAVDANVFTLGEISVTAKQDAEAPLSTTTLDDQQLWDFSRNSLPDALNLVPGVASTAGAGTRNETLISVRGFERWRVPLLLDGIRLYLPADNRIDFDRFLTPDLSEIQVSRGYVSVINGPDGIGGAINLVTRKPVKPLEAEVRAEALLAGGGQKNGDTLYADLGGRQEKWYWQVSAEERDRQRWRVSDDFQATPLQGDGVRTHASSKDSRYNVKLGLTPNSTDEYSFNYVTQSGDKHGVGSVIATKTNTSTISSWDWPTWDTSSVYFLSKTQVADRTTLQTKAYYNTFKNTLWAYTSPTLGTTNFISYYDDNAKGLSVEVDTDHFTDQTLKAAVYWRRDEHTEWQYLQAASTAKKGAVTYVLSPANFTEPKQTTIEDTASLALEDTWHLTRKLDLVGGLSRDMRIGRQAQDFASVTGTSPSVLFDYKTANSYATNYQAAAIYSYSDTGKVHVSASDRTRFPTMFERYSSRFGGAMSNPWLKPERALNLEVGVADNLTAAVRGEVALFRSHVQDPIESVPIVYNGAAYTQNQNVGEETYEGAEVGLTARLLPSLEIGGNYSYIDTRIDNPNDAGARLTTTPRTKGFVYAKWTPTEKWSVVPSLEHASSRWSSSAANSALYVQTGAYTLANLKVEYQFQRDWSVSLSGRNLTDKNYQVVDGYPQEGRNFVVAMRYRY